MKWSIEENKNGVGNPKKQDEKEETEEEKREKENVIKQYRERKSERSETANNKADVIRREEKERG